ncbi:MAG: CTP synthetase [Candidatus Pelagibacter sp.]|nr:CTP synthetase [Candidatus Pelagibacter sp.]OUW11657.1 MAG: CTP synthetase [Candidatus Pelagibacter sp. TMED166]|tara:strand:- start:23873 stop:25498 length:1626 start_codon:yes stop_codon:yes gene_type:complete
MARFIFVTGGVVSSIGKGLSSASLASLLISQGYKVRVRKLDPYLNIDPGTMSPFQHGEVFVTDDGAETDLDLGHYERFTNTSSRQSDNITTGKIYSDILKREREGGYLGKTVQVIPHVTDRIKQFIKHDTKKEDFVICEIGGTVGDIESLPFLEAIRQFSNDIEKKNTLFIHLTLVPYIKSSSEIKTKPTQHSVKELRSIGIQPDIIICRCEHSIPVNQRQKIALFCNVDIKNVIETIDVKTIYEAPLSFHKQKLDKQVLNYFKLKPKKQINLKPWKHITASILNKKRNINIGLVGKYVDYKDAYKSVDEALIHGGLENDINVNIIRIESQKLNKKNIKNYLKNINGILIPGGFGLRGTEGKILAIKYARLKKIPFLGICFGMQLAMVEFARNVLKLKKAGSTELNKNCTPVIGLINEWIKKGKIIKGTDVNLGGTMRLGLYNANLKTNSKIKSIYKKTKISERHRHRYEVNMNFKDKFQKKGMIFSALSPDKTLTEGVELIDHPWFIGVQFHPEFKSRPMSVHPLFNSFINASKINNNEK